jgi:hypothetical protein
VKKEVTITMSTHAAAAVRQVLFEAQKGYTYDVTSVPPRIFEMREVITDLDDAIEFALKE